MLELIEQNRLAVDELIDVMGRACVEAVLALLPGKSPVRQSKEGHGRATSSGTAVSVAGCD